MIQNSPDVFVELDENGTQKYVSPVVEQYTGYTPEEFQMPVSESSGMSTY